MDKYFTSNAAKYIFGLTQMDGLNRSHFLGITENLYLNKDLASEWKENIEISIAEFKDIDYDAYTLAMNKLYDFYTNMIKD